MRELAFKPTINDPDRLSLSRERVGPVGAAATGPVGRSLFVATVRFAALIWMGLTVVADREDHAVVADLTHAARQSKEPATRERLAKLYGRLRLVRAVGAASGPFPGQTVWPIGPPPPPSPA